MDAYFGIHRSKKLLRGFGEGESFKERGIEQRDIK